MKRRIRHNAPGHAHLLTFSCYRGRPLLLEKGRPALLSRSIDAAIDRHPFVLTAFVYMPEHVHLIVTPTKDKYDVSALLFAIKRPFSYRVKKILQASTAGVPEDLMVRERPGRMSFRFRQEGGGHDRNIISPRAALAAASHIHNNPVRRGLSESPDGWKWSSWSYYHRPEEYDRSALPTISRLTV